MALPAANMDDCTPKKRCIFGPNEGQAYDALDPCQGSGIFNSLTCDCEILCDTPATATVFWKVSFATYAAACAPDTTLCFDFGNTPYSRQVTDLAPGAEIVVTTQGTGVFGTCSGTENTTAVITYLACVDGSPAFRTVVIGAPGCSVNTSSGAIATPYDVSVVYD
jgi:hypothetical protein